MTKFKPKMSWQEISKKDKQQHPHIMPMYDMENGSLPWMMENYSQNEEDFNLYWFHTNFNISPVVYEILRNSPGVEVLMPISPYRVKIGIGKMFNDRDVRMGISMKIFAYFDRLDALIVYNNNDKALPESGNFLSQDQDFLPPIQ